MNIEILLILVLVMSVCVIPGVFLSLKNMAMISDALSHSILLGIVLGFFISFNLNSPILIIGAMLVGLFTTWFINFLARAKKVNMDGSIGIVFPFLFAVGILLISVFVENVHLDVDSILLGEVIFAPLNRIMIFGLSIPKSIINIVIVLLINLFIVVLCYKEFKVYSFDENLCHIMGFNSVLISYLLMSMVAITSVVSFNVVGSILVIALMIGPASIARLYVNDLKRLIFLSFIIGYFCVVLGYFIAIVLNVAVAGSIAFVIGCFFIMSALFTKRHGIIYCFIKHRRDRHDLNLEVIMIHLYKHKEDINYEEEAGIFSINDHLFLDKKDISNSLEYALKKKLIMIKNDVYFMTDIGIEYVKDVKDKYNVKF